MVLIVVKISSCLPRQKFNLNPRVVAFPSSFEFQSCRISILAFFVRASGNGRSWIVGAQRSEMRPDDSSRPVLPPFSKTSLSFDSGDGRVCLRRDEQQVGQQVRDVVYPCAPVCASAAAAALRVWSIAPSSPLRDPGNPARNPLATLVLALSVPIRGAYSRTRKRVD